MIIIIVAVSMNGVIGKNGQLPWKIGSDLRRFRELTINNTVIMGRKTYESIGHPLKNRTNIIMTRDKQFNPVGVEITRSFEDALLSCLRHEKIFIIGGEGIYKQFMPLASLIYMTIVRTKIENGDAHFSLDLGSDWELVNQEDFTKEKTNDEFDSSFCTFERINKVCS